MTLIERCMILEYVHNTRGDPPRCRLESIRIGEKRVRCLSFKPDHSYLGCQLRVSTPIVTAKLGEEYAYHSRQPGGGPP